jgi:hypothetical protein
MNFLQALKIAEGVLNQYREDHPKWWKRMDGTPILSDLAVRMAAAFVEDTTCEKKQTTVTAKTTLLDEHVALLRMSLRFDLQRIADMSPFGDNLFSSSKSLELLKKLLLSAVQDIDSLVLQSSAEHEPTAFDLCIELREALGLAVCAMPIPPKQAWDEAMCLVRALKA